MKILYVEDSPTLRKSVAKGLRRAGYTVTVSADGPEGLDIALVHDFDVIVLDVMLPGLSGFEILKRLRDSGDRTEVLLLTARISVEDRVTGLDLGADDYLVKPFAFEELLARIRVLVRRSFESKTNVLFFAGIRIDLSARRIFFQDREISLRPREFDILECLALKSGKIVSRTELIEHVYDHAVDLKSNTVDSAICNIRKCLSDAGAEHIITTVPRRGYLLDATA